jgi:hypothetical protein
MTSNNPHQGSVKENLLKAVLGHLMSLPAYKLRDKYQQIFDDYTCLELSKSITRKSLKKNSPKSNDPSALIKSNELVYLLPSQWKIYWYSFESLPNKDKNIGWIVIASFFGGFLFRIGVKFNNSLVALAGAISLLIFLYSFLIYGLRLNLWIQNVQITFSILRKVLNNIYSYIDAIGEIDEEKLHNKVEMISKNIIEDELSSLSYRSKRVNVFNLVFAFLISFIVVYISGNTFIIYTKWIAEHLGFGDFEFIKKLSMESFAIFILFPISVALSRDVVISGLQQRNQDLRQSLAILKDRFEDYKSEQRPNQTIQSYLTSQEQEAKRLSFHKTLIASGLVRRIKNSGFEQRTYQQLIESQGKPVSETIIEERR